MAYEAIIENLKLDTRRSKIGCFNVGVLDPKYEAVEFACIEGERDISNR